MKNFKPVYLVYAAIAALIIWAIWYFGFRKKNGNGNIPDSFYKKQCGGIPAIWKTKYYKEDGKYYTITESPIQTIVAIQPTEISEQDYITAYKDSKIPCDPMLPRLSNNSNFSERAMAPVKWKFYNTTKLGNGRIEFNGNTPLPLPPNKSPKIGQVINGITSQYQQSFSGKFFGLKSPVGKIALEFTGPLPIDITNGGELIFN